MATLAAATVGMETNNIVDTSAWHASNLDMDVLEVCAVYDFVIETVLMGLLCLLGFAGNILSVICLQRDKSKTATPFLLISLEVADTAFLSTVVLLRVCDSAIMFAGWQGGSILVPVTRFLFPVAQIAMTSTVYLTLLVTLNRYLSVCRPHQVVPFCESRHAKAHVAIVVGFSVLFNIPRFFEYELAKVGNGGMLNVECKACKVWCVCGVWLGKC